MNGSQKRLFTWIITATLSAGLCDARAEIPEKTSGCPDQFASLDTALNPPPNYPEYAYFCYGAKDQQVMINGVAHREECGAVKAGPFRIRIPASDAYENSEQYAKYIEALRKQCASADPLSGAMARFYYPGKDAAKAPPELCDIVDDRESCTDISPTKVMYSLSRKKSKRK